MSVNKGYVKRNILKDILSNRYMYVLIFPGILYFLIFSYLPMIGLYIAFSDYNIFTKIWDAPFVGLKNFKDIFASLDFRNVLTNTILISTYKMVVGFPVPIILALFINELKNRYFKRGIQTIIYLPHFISWVVIGGIMLAIFSPSYGILGDLTRLLGGKPINIMATPSLFRPILVASEIWKSSGWGTIIYLAALSTIDLNYYEAAKIDGASRFQQMRHISLPCISGVVVLLMILNIGGLMNAGFEQIFVLTNPVVQSVCDIFDTFVYRFGLQQGNYSFSTAVGLFKSVVAVILIYGSDRIAKLIGEEGLFE